MADTYTVVKGDTLWSIAERFLGSGSQYTLLAQINNIANPQLIYVGQVIKLSSGGESPSDIDTPDSDQTQVTIEHFGLQADTDSTVFVTWKWDKDHTQNYEVLWEYYTTNKLWFIGNRGTTEEKQSTYNIPTNATVVRVKIKPVSETYTVNDAETTYWTASWSEQKRYYKSSNPPTTPSVPSVTVDGYKLTAILENLDVNADSIQFQVIKNNSSVFSTGTIKISTKYAAYSCNLNAGAEYKVRARSVRGELYSNWSDYSSNVTTKPAASSGIKVCRASSATSVYLEWGTVSNAETYELEYTTKVSYFDGSGETTSVSAIEYGHYEVTGLESGEQYFFRVRAVNGQGESAWSTIKSVIIGKKPSAPTTWSSATTITVGEVLHLYWVHNSEDGSSETYGELEMYVDGKKESHTLKKSTDEDEKDKTSVYSVKTSSYRVGAKIQWRVRTAGITKDYGDWSVQREVTIYAPPTLELTLKNQNGYEITALKQFPLIVSALAGPNTQAPTGYYLSITANSDYETVDSVGRTKTVKAGDEVYSKYFDITEALEVSLSADSLDVENNIYYTVTCIVSMNSGLTAKAKKTIKVLWSENTYTPNAEIAIDRDTLVAYIRPYCNRYGAEFHKVTKSGDTYKKTATLLASSTTGTAVVNAFTTTGEMVFLTADGGTYFCVTASKTGTLVSGIKLAVYRREFDGSFTLIADNLTNTDKTYVTDPHPALDYARYRIVAVETKTGGISYYDPPGYPVGEKSIVLQWDEAWTNFNTTEEEALVEPPWSGSMLKLPYNIDVKDKHDSDVELVSYIGRTHPVSYYGTQRGETSEWSTDIVADDKDTLYALRRLAIWMGDVYVREPSGTGYWARISVSYDLKHRELTVPVSFSITRVEGGL